MDEILLDIGSSSTVSQAIKDDVLKMENVNLFKCQVCKISVTGIIPAEAHLQGVKHKKAVQKFKLDAAVEQNYDIQDSFISEVQAAIKSKLVSCNHLGNQIVLTCVLCNKSCSGEVPMAQHLSSEAHAKKMRHGSLTSSCEKFPIPNTCTTCYDSASPTNVPPSMQDFPVSDNPHSMDFIPISPDVQAAIKSGLISSTQLGNQVILTCVPCNKPCSGEMPMMQHLSCEAHAKKMRHGVQYSSCSPQTGRPIITIPAITQCSLTSPADIQLVQGDLLAQAMKEGTIKASENTANHLYCTVCDVSCTGEDCMKNHLQGKSHFKMLKVFRQTSKQSLRSSVSSTINNTDAQHSPSPPEDGTAHKDKSVSPHFSPISPVSGWEELSLMDEVVVKSEDGYKCTICKITCNSQRQIFGHLQGDPHKKQYRLRQTAHQLVGASESHGRSPIFPLNSTPDDFGFTSIISPPSMFKDSPRCNTPPKEKMKFEESGGRFIEESSNSAKRKYLQLESNKKQYSKNIKDFLPDIKIYASKDQLTDLFAE
uniref:C2H2-type domain-containing protein n=1 Tax=Scylla olivacea TaxID=85551 RepID=A0A0P4VTB5_SCYOL